MCKGVDTSHGHANNNRLGEGGEIGKVFEKTDLGFDCGTNYKKRRVNLKRTQTQLEKAAEEPVAVPREDTQLQDLISSKCVKRIPPNTENWLRKLYNYSMNNDGDNSLQHHNLDHKKIPMPQVLKIPAAKSSGGQGTGKIGENFGVEPDESQK